MSETKQKNTFINVVNDPSGSSSTHNSQTDGANERNKLLLYLSIILIIFVLAVALEIFRQALPAETTSLFPVFQVILLITGLFLSAFVSFSLRPVNKSPGNSKQLQLLNDRIALKSHSLEILYDAAAGVTDFHGLDELLTRFLITLKNLVQAQAAMVRVLNDDNQMRLVAKTGISDNNCEVIPLIPQSQCLTGSSIANSSILKTKLDNLKNTGLSNFSHSSFSNNELSLITIPIQYSEKTLGVYQLILHDTSAIETNEIIQLFTSIGRHLGIVVEKVKLENHARRISIIQERTSLANELHDSLAQTLASLRFQITMVDETVSQSRDRTGILQIRAIKDGLDQANNQLRELLSHFRTRMDERGLLPAIESLVERFQKETGIAAFFQNEVTKPILSPSIEVQVLHIVQEALTNVRKHSHAENVRVLIRSDDKANYHVLVEDDGQGMQGKNMVAGPGEHIGLAIMQERAERLSGTLSIETEAGEGTRVELSFKTPKETKTI